MSGVILSSVTAATVQLAGNWVCDVRELLLLLLEVLGVGGTGVLIEPVGGLLNGLKDLVNLLVKLAVTDFKESTYSLLVIIINLASKTLLIVDLVLQAESVVLKTVTGLNALLGSLVLIGVLLSLLNHTVNLLLSKTSLVVGDGDGLGLSGALVTSGNLEDSVGIKLERDLDLWDTTGCRWNASQLELSKLVVVL